MGGGGGLEIQWRKLENAATRIGTILLATGKRVSKGRGVGIASDMGLDLLIQ